MATRISPLRLEIHEGDFDTVQEWIKAQAAIRRDQHWWSLFWALAWEIWKRRNVWVFERKRMEIHRVTQSAANLVLEFINANEQGKKNPVTTSTPQLWNPPTQLCYKLNTDAAVFGNNSVGLGAVLRDCTGDVLMATCEKVCGNAEPDVAEALALRHGLKITLESGFHAVILETDCMKLSNQLQKGKGDKSAFGMIVNDILNLAKQCSIVSFSHVARSGNHVAHTLAKNSCLFESLRVWLEEYPPFVQGIVMADCMPVNQ